MAHANAAHPALSWHWKFGDWVELEGDSVHHAWTEPGNYTVEVTACGLDNQASERECQVHVNGYLSTVFAPSQNKTI